MENPERSVSSDDALERVNQEIACLGMTQELVQLGLQNPCYSCLLYNSEGAFVEIGHGKGKKLQGRLSAKYEALEHYLSGINSQMHYHRRYCSFKSLSAAVTPRNISFVERVLKQDQFDKQTFWYPFKAISENHTFYIPGFFLFPDQIKYFDQIDEIDYNYSETSSTNNGTAIGCNFNEALLHAINECIERDALSCFLLRHFIHPQSNRAEPDETPGSRNIYNSSLRSEVESSFQEKLVIHQIQKDLRFPVFCAQFSRQNQEVQPIGFGCSLSAEYAIERAIWEACQTFHLHRRHPLKTDLGEKNKEILDLFKPFPALQRCLKFDTSHIKLKTGLIEDFVPNSSIETSCLDQLLHETLERLKEYGMTVYYNIHYSSLRTGIVCLRVIIPELEFFHLVRHGKFVLPGQRGRALLRNIRPA